MDDKEKVKDFREERQDAEGRQDVENTVSAMSLEADTSSTTKVPTASLSLTNKSTPPRIYQEEINMEHTMALTSQRTLASLMQQQAARSEVARSSPGRLSEDEALMIKVDSSPGSCVAREIHVHHHEVDNTILENMKARSKSTLKDFNQATFYPTKAVQAAREKLHYGHVCLEGKPKSGKSSIGLYLLATFGDRNYTPLILNNPDEYSHISQKERFVILIDDIFGSRVFMPDMVIRWNKVIENIFHAKSIGRIFLIITSESGFFDRSQAFSSFDEFLDKTHRLQLQNPDFFLRDYEKFAILEKLATFKRLAHDCRILSTAANASTHPWFFDCCKYLLKNKLPLQEWPIFFRHPVVVLCEHVAKLEPIKSALLILIMKHNHILDTDFSTTSDGQMILKASLDILSRIMELPHGCDLKDVRDAAQALTGDLVVYNDQHYSFSHDAVREAVCFTFSKVAPVYFIQWCPLDFLIHHTVTENTETEGAHSVKIDSNLFPNLKDRIVQDFTADFVEHDVFKGEAFVYLFFQDNPILDDAQNIPEIVSSIARHGHAYFLRQILHIMEGFGGLDIEHIKHEALEKACSFRQATVADILLDSDAKPCEVCFHNACGGQMLNVVKHFLSMGPISWSNDVVSLLNALRTTTSPTDISAMLQNATKRNVEGRGLVIMAQACETGNWELYNVLSDNLIDRTLKCRDLLPHAISGGNLLIVCDLIGKDPNILNVDCDESAFLVACRCNKVELAKLIWDESSVTAKSRIYEEGSSSLRALHIAVLASNEDQDLLKWLLIEGFPINGCGGSSRTPLHTACSRGIVGGIRVLLEKKADVSAVDADGNTMLHLACGSDKPNKDIVKLLLDNGANISSLNKENKTPLHVLCGKQHNSRSVVISFLLNCEAPVNTMDMNGHTPFYLLLDRGFCLEEVELLLDNGAKVNMKDNFEETAVHAACRSSNCRAVEMLLQNGGDLQARDRRGQSCLHHAVSVMNNGDVVKYLLQRGLSVNIVDTDGNTPLHTAVHVQFNNIVVELLMTMGADSTLTNKDGDAPLHLVCKDSLDHSLEYMDIIMNKSSLLLSKEDNTPLHLASMSKGNAALSVVKKLLDSDVNISEKNESAKTALHLACERSDEPGCSMAQALCARNAELDCQDNEGNTPLHLACLSGGDSRLHMIELLINQGAKVNIINDQHISPIDIIEDRKNESEHEILMIMVDSMLNQACLGNGRYTMEEVEEVLSKETQLSLLDKEQRPVLHRICSVNGQHSPTIISMLLAQGADIAAKAKDGLTAIHAACMAIGPFTETVLETLIRSGGDVNERDDQGQTAFHKACTLQDSHTENVLGKLQQYGIDVNLPDGNGNTPLHMVCGSSGAHILDRIQWLLGQGADWQYLNHEGHTPYNIANDEIRNSFMNLILLKYCEDSDSFDKDVICGIISEGADVNCLNNDGNSVLHMISQKNGKFSLENILLMISNGCDKGLLNNAGVTAYELGIYAGMDEEVLQLLCPDEQDVCGGFCPDEQGACGGSEASTKEGGEQSAVDHVEKLKNTALNFKDLLGNRNAALIVGSAAEVVESAAAVVSKWVKESS